ncbi:MAG TPA: thiamine-phosphate kinase, partial [Acetobacteraceae bacterium]
AAARQAGPDWLPAILTGGDDYELLLAVPPGREAALHNAARDAGISVTRIGGFRAGPPGVMVRGPGGEEISLTNGGWSHF